ncbi:bifunctional serine/threonine-protein kinase/formylglycine-generating enzyme family protein [Tautonia sociabilis]|uniref:Protein kinase domain-containing protein n=1 Tax=Tautonia sociabilis TaxID=2080755 RepID=A0A432MN68_9BACT|nr:bifunctional serine/threonine-protein kinase/formylglycine-generating enzyme family protein [Tautonia sociabilis]RUL88689.1 hypothetical protein TsocGM_06010 [Tautonia sociabilis]
MAGREDGDLLFGVVALQLGLVDREAVLAAIGARSREEGPSVEEQLTGRGGLGPEDAALVREVVARLGERGGTLPLPPAGAARRNGNGKGGRSRSLPAGPALGETIADPAFARAIGQGTAGASPAGLSPRPDCRGGEGGDDPFATVAVALPAVGAGPGLAERFRPIRFHARGGLGEVWIARDRELNREVALKQIRDQFADDRQGRARFVLEAEVTGGLEHPGIVPVYGLGTHPDGRPYYAMRLIRGESYQDAIDRFHAVEVSARKTGPRELALRQLLRRLQDVCNALAYAHSRGVIHRDIKPSNIMLGPFGETLLVDWGLAKAIGRGEGIDASISAGEETLAPCSGNSVEETVMGQRLGTPAYMAPEQAAGRLDEVGAASDVYSLGATLYHLLAGRPPFSGDDLAGLMARVERGEFPPPRCAQPWVDRALEAVCLKAMARRPEDRYGSARALAEDLERWLADEPVRAWREPRSRAARRWVLRHQALVAAVLVAVGALFLFVEAYFTVRLQAAHGWVEALESAEIRAVPDLLIDLGADRALVRGRLRAMADPPQPDPELRLRGALALLPDEPSRAEFLTRFVVEPQATPEDVLVIRQALVTHGHAHQAAEWIARMLPPPGQPLDAASLRACGMMAGLNPNWSGWPDYFDAIADALTHDDPIWISTRAEVFEPIADRLAEPLRRIYADRSEPEARGLAFALLMESALREPNPNRDEDFAALVPEADPLHASRILQQIPEPQDRRRMVEALVPMLGLPSRFDDARAERQGRVAAMLARMGAAEHAWPLLRSAEDPALRTKLIHQLAPFDVDPTEVADRLLAEPDPSARRALVLALGEYPENALVERRREAVASTLLQWFRDDPDPGLHAAIDWLLRRRWGLGGALDALMREVATTDPVADRDWYVSLHGNMTFVVVRGPASFLMGSTPRSDPERSPDEVAHPRRIDRGFAIADREVTAAEFASFVRNHPDIPSHRDPSMRREIPTSDCPTGAVTWYEAARFCNWASELAGIPQDQWCYPEPIGPGMSLPDDLLERTGYRLPTEAEWEYACRAGSLTSRPFGGSERRLGEYAWSIANADRVMHPVASLKPNDLGLFDMLGNAFEWCQDPYRESPPLADGDVVPDRLEPSPVVDDEPRVLRGGSFSVAAPDLRSAARTWDRPNSTSNGYGFRLARTLPPSP